MNEEEMPQFTHERVQSHTGKVQFRTDGASVANIGNGQRRVTRGEVVAFANEEFTTGLVRTGNFIHVAADTPVTNPVPETSKPSPKRAVFTEGQVRGVIAGVLIDRARAKRDAGEQLSAEEEEWLREADAAAKGQG